MKRVCTNCGTISSESSLWCETRYCPSGTLTTLFDFGEYLGDLQIVRLLRVLPTAALYEAQRGKQTVFLKVAHDGASDLIKREALVLQQAVGVTKDPKKAKPGALPMLLPAYPYTTPGEERPYGKTTVGNDIKYYMVFNYVKGEFLRDMLIRNPQPWYQHAAWISIALAEAVGQVEHSGKLAVVIDPDAVLLRTDQAGVLRPMLLDLSLASEPNAVNLAWIQQFAPPSYVAPELLEKGMVIGAGLDVYALGLIFYEMLAGQPVFPYRLQKPDEIRTAVRAGELKPLNRGDLAEDVIGIVMQSVAKSPARRQPDAAGFAKALRSKFGEPPAEKRGGIQIDRQFAAVLVFGLLALVAWLVLATVLANV